MTAAMGVEEPATATADRDLIERHVARVIAKPQALEVCLIPTCEASAQAEDPRLQDPAPCQPESLPRLWTSCRRPPDPRRAPCEPVSVCNPTGLQHAETEIGKWRAETGAQDPTGKS
jgi:hypothetical protein